MQTCKSGPKDAVFMEKNTDEGWNPYRLVILVQITLVCMHKATGYIWAQVLFNPVQKSLFCVHKQHMRAGTHRD